MDSSCSLDFAMFPIPLMTSGTDRHLNSPSLQSKCPLPPFVVHKSLEFSLKETACTIQAVKEALEAGRLEDAVTYLESLKTKLVPLGKVADSQIRAHGRKPKEQPATSLVTDVVATRAFPESCVPPIPVPTISVDPSLVSESRRVMRHLTAVCPSDLLNNLCCGKVSVTRPAFVCSYVPQAISSVGVSSSEDGLQGAPPTTASAFDSQVVKPRRPRLLWTPEDDELLAKGLKEFGTGVCVET